MYSVALIEVCMAVTIILSCSKTNFMFLFTIIILHDEQNLYNKLLEFTFTIEIKFFNRRSQVGSSLALTKVVVCGGWGRRLSHYLVRMTWMVKKNQYSPYYRRCKFSTKSLKYIKLNWISFVLLFQWTTRKIHLQYMVDAFWINVVHLFWFPHNWLLQQCSFCLDHRIISLHQKLLSIN